MNSPGSSPPFEEFNTERWRHIEKILDLTLDLPPERVAEILDRECAGDTILRNRVEKLLKADRSSADFLETPAIELASDLLDDLETPEVQGACVGPWRIIREIGRGGMGAVYLAERAEGGYSQNVALKLLKRGLDTDEILARFRMERQILARLEHPGIARLIDGGVTQDGRPYLAMEFVEGTPLNRHIKSAGLNLKEVLNLFVQVCQAVDYAHRNLVVHRDLKPSNVHAVSEGGVKLLDFGIAKVLEPNEAEVQTSTVGPRMTPLYAAPEQVRGDPPTTATDVYSLGVILFELLTGKMPYKSPTASPTDLENAILEEDPDRPSATVERLQLADRPGWHRELKGDLDNIVLNALRKEPEKRYASAEALREDLDRYLSGKPVRATSPTISYRASRFVKRNRVAVVGGVLVMSSVIVGLTGTLWQANKAAQERDHALQEARKAEKIKDFTLGLFSVSDPAQSLGGDITARELLERGVSQVDAELASQPVVRVEMLQLLGSIYHKLGEYPRAESLAVRSVELARSSSQADADLTAKSLHWLGVIRRDRSDFKGAREALIEALRIRRRSSGERNREYAASLGELASVYRQEGNLDSAEVLFRQALEIDRAILGPAQGEIAVDMDNLAVLLSDLDRDEEAAALHRQALEISESTFGHDHPSTATTLTNLAFALTNLSRFAEAESSYAEALSIRLRILGPDHIDVAHSYGNYADLKRYIGDFSAAFEMYEAALAIEREALGPSHPEVTRSINNLAILYFQQARYSVALERFEEALRIRRQTLPPDDRGCLTMEHNIACCLRELGRYEEAEHRLRDVRRRRRRALGENHLDIANSDHHLGILLHRRGKNTEAEQFLRSALAARTQKAGAVHRLTAQTAIALADLLRSTGAFEESRSLYERAISINESIFNEPGPQSADALVGLGRLSLEEKHYAEAKKWLRMGIGIRSKLFGDSDPRTLEASNALQSCLAAQP